jgi:hypothetical protein
LWFATSSRCGAFVRPDTRMWIAARFDTRIDPLLVLERAKP